MKSKTAIVVAIMLVLGAGPTSPPKTAASAQNPAAGVPRFEVNPYWPRMDGSWKADWMFGSIGGVTVDPRNDRVWVL